MICIKIWIIKIYKICLDGDNTGKSTIKKILDNIPKSSIYLNLPNNQDLNEINNMYYKAQELNAIKLICKKIASAVDDNRVHDIVISSNLANKLANFIAEDDKKTEILLPLSTEKFTNFLNHIIEIGNLNYVQINNLILR